MCTPCTWTCTHTNTFPCGVLEMTFGSLRHNGGVSSGLWRARGSTSVFPVHFKTLPARSRGLGCPHKGPSWRLSLPVFSVAAERQNFSSVLEMKQVWGSNHLSRHVSWDFQCSDAHLKSLHLWARFPPVFHWQPSFPLIITCELPRRLPLVKKHLLKFQKQLCMFSITVSVCCWLSGCALFPVHMHRYGGFILDFLILSD